MTAADVVIVGGGPAGSTAAWQLRQLGADVLVLDKADFPRNKVCAGWITPAITETLKLDTAEYAASNTLQTITGFRTSVLSGNEASINYDNTISYGIRRREFDHYLLQRSHAKTLTGYQVRNIERKGNGFIINNEIEAKLLLGAGGHACPVSRFIGNRPGKHETIVSAQEIEFQMTPEQLAQCRVDGLQPELYFCDDLKGYAWVFRKGDYLNIGLGREENRHLSQHVNDFVETLVSRGRIPANMPGRFSGHAYLLHGHGKRKAVDDGVMLLGDALGLAYPQSGEGIRPAIESAIFACSVINAANSNYSMDRLLHYTKKLEQRFGPLDSSHTAQSNWIPQKLMHWLARYAVGNPWFARHVVMDKWFLHRSQPALPSLRA